MVGIVKQRINRINSDRRCDVQLYIEAVSIKRCHKDKDTDTDTTSATTTEGHHHSNHRTARHHNTSHMNDCKRVFDAFWCKHSKQPMKARNMILSNLCPQLYGMYVVKLAVALTIIGGIAREDEHNQTRVRGQSHLLMVGDPGTGKSQLLRCWLYFISLIVFLTCIHSVCV